MRTRLDACMVQAYIRYQQTCMKAKCAEPGGLLLNLETLAEVAQEGSTMAHVSARLISRQMPRRAAWFNSPLQERAAGMDAHGDEAISRKVGPHVKQSVLHA